MIGNSFARLTGSKRNLLALMASSAVFTAGCANMATTASNPTPLGQAATLSGKIHGGNQPVIGATVNLYFSGLKGGTPAVIAGIAISVFREGEGTQVIGEGSGGQSGRAGLTHVPKLDLCSADGLITTLNLSAERGGRVEWIDACWGHRHIRAAGSEDDARCQKREQISL